MNRRDRAKEQLVNYFELLFKKAKLSFYYDNQVEIEGIIDCIFDEIDREIMKNIVAKYKKWKEEHPDLDYQYDEILEFVSELRRDELHKIFETIENVHSGGHI